MSRWYGIFGILVLFALVAIGLYFDASAEVICPCDTLDTSDTSSPQEAGTG